MRNSHTTRGRPGRRCLRLAVWAAALVLAGAGARAQSPAGFLEETPDAVSFHNDAATLVIGKHPWSMRLAAAPGHPSAPAPLQPGEPASGLVQSDPLALQIDGQWVTLQAVTGATAPAARAARLRLTLSDGSLATADVSPFGPAGFHVVVRAEQGATGAIRGSIDLRPVEEIYGFGEMWNGHVAQRGQAFDLVDRGGTPDECAYMPYYVSTADYALFLNYGGKVHFDVGQHRSDRLAFSAPAAEIDLTVVVGRSIASTVQNFLTEVGLPRRPPRWAFQPWFWLMGDPDQPGAKIDTLRGRQFVAMVDRLHALNIPVGVTWFEPPWQSARTSFLPNPVFSPDLKQLVADLRAKGVRTLAWTVPYTTAAAPNWGEAVARGFLARKPGAEAAAPDVTITASGELPPGAYYNSIDFFNPEATAWWGAQIERSLGLGLAGYKLDAGQDLEADAQLAGHRRGRDVHNSYALQYNKAVFGALQRRLGDDFLMIPRAAWVGSSAYTNFKWPGDLAGTFGNNGLPSSVYSSLSLAFCGLPFVSTDIGGFEDQPPPERVWLRWAQFGAMLPGMQTLHMPWWYSKASVDHFRYLAWLHTDLTPLWMTLAHEAAATGAPVVRPLVWTFQGDIDSWRVDDEFTVGTSLLVAPILNSNYERSVYLPAGRWYDFWDNAQAITGPVRFNWTKGWSVNDRFPMFIREGAIIPMEIVNDVTGFGTAQSRGFVTLAIWPRAGGKSEFILHDTEGPVRITADARAASTLVIGWDATRRHHLLRIHDADGQTPTAVTADGTPLRAFDSLAAFQAGGEGWCLDAATRNIWVRKLNHGAPGEVRIAWGPAKTEETKR